MLRERLWDGAEDDDENEGRPVHEAVHSSPPRGSSACGRLCSLVLTPIFLLYALLFALYFTIAICWTVVVTFPQPILHHVEWQESLAVPPLPSPWRVLSSSSVDVTFATGCYATSYNATGGVFPLSSVSGPICVFNVQRAWSEVLFGRFFSHEPPQLMSARISAALALAFSWHVLVAVPCTTCAGYLPSTWRSWRAVALGSALCFHVVLVGSAVASWTAVALYRAEFDAFEPLSLLPSLVQQDVQVTRRAGNGWQLPLLTCVCGACAVLLQLIALHRWACKRRAADGEQVVEELGGPPPPDETLPVAEA